jgi:hypothetical protein
LIAELALTSKRSAASRRDAPDSTVSSTRSRKSKEQGFGIDLPHQINAARLHHPNSPGNPPIQSSRNML